MNGVRRLLGTATSSSPPNTLQDSPLAQVAPLTFTPKSGPNWPPQSPSISQQQLQQPVTPTGSPKTTPALFFKKERQRSQPSLSGADDDVGGYSSLHAKRPSIGSAGYTTARTQAAFSISTSASRASVNGRSSPASGPSSSPHVPPKASLPQVNPTTVSEWKRASGIMNTRDELLMSLMASEAVVDCRDFEILSAEEVEELKKEQQVLNSRLGAMAKKVSLETKIRDAAISLSKVNTSHKKVSQQTEEQLEAANRRVDAAQKDLWRVSERVNEVNKLLLEHRAGVLSFSVRNMERKMTPSEDSGYDSNRSTLMSPTSSMTGISSSSKTRFEGAHFFSGHADAVTPKRKFSPESAAAEITALEMKLKAATDSLTAAGKKQVKLTRELSLMRLEKQEVETIMGMDLQSAEDTILTLQSELPLVDDLKSQVNQLLQEKDAWEKERAELAEKRLQVESLQAQIATLALRESSTEGTEKAVAEQREEHLAVLEEKNVLIETMRAEWDEQREAWEQQRARAEDEKMEDLARLQDEMERLQEEDRAALVKTQEDLEDGIAELQAMFNQHGVSIFTRDSSLHGLLKSLGMHLEAVQKKLEGHVKAEAEWDVLRRKLEEDVRTGLEKREALMRELEETRRGDLGMGRTSLLKSESLVMQSPQLSLSSLPPSLSPPPDVDVAKIVSILQPIWTILPSPEARAAKFSGSPNQRFRTGSPTASPIPLNGAVTSLSDLDVRSLKHLYDTRQQTPTSPRGSGGAMGVLTGGGGGMFTIEAFAARVQALIADDRALIERLVRFAQAHDLLKKNAERAQKLAQEGNLALETYQRQVRMLEERNMSATARQAALQEEVQLLQDAIERLTAEKHEVEMLAAEQAETCAQLTDANNTLSARTLSLAEEAASAPEMVKKQLEAQLNESRKALEAAQGEVEAMRSSEQLQRIALLDELNLMQTENGQLRAQLRATKK